MINFVDNGTDALILQSLPVENCSEELVKAMSKQGMVQKDVTVKGKNGKTFIRKQWVRASDVAGTDKSSVTSSFQNFKDAHHAAEADVGKPSKNSKEIVDAVKAQYIDEVSKIGKNLSDSKANKLCKEIANQCKTTEMNVYYEMIKQYKEFRNSSNKITQDAPKADKKKATPAPKATPKDTSSSKGANKGTVVKVDPEVKKWYGLTGKETKQDLVNIANKAEKRIEVLYQDLALATNPSDKKVYENKIKEREDKLEKLDGYIADLVDGKTLDFSIDKPKPQTDTPKISSEDIMNARVNLARALKSANIPARNRRVKEGYLMRTSNSDVTGAISLSYVGKTTRDSKAYLDKMAESLQKEGFKVSYGIDNKTIDVMLDKNAIKPPTEGGFSPATIQATPPDNKVPVIPRKSTVDNKVSTTPKTNKDTPSTKSKNLLLNNEQKRFEEMIFKPDRYTNTDTVKNALEELPIGTKIETGQVRKNDPSSPKVVYTKKDKDNWEFINSSYDNYSGLDVADALMRLAAISTKDTWGLSADDDRNYPLEVITPATDSTPATSKADKKETTPKADTPKASSNISFDMPSDGDAKKAVKDMMMKTSKKEVMDAAKAQGITWTENANEGINWMRASMAIQKYMKGGTSAKTSPKPAKTTPTKPTSVSFKLPAHGDVNKAIKDMLNSGLTEVDIMNAAKSQGIKWEEQATNTGDDKKDIQAIKDNWKRASKAIKEHMTGRNSKIKTSDTPKASSGNVDTTHFDSIKSDKPKAMEYLKSNGITWDESDNMGINWMRAMMAYNKAMGAKKNKTKATQSKVQATPKADTPKASSPASTLTSEQAAEVSKATTGKAKVETVKKLLEKDGCMAYAKQLGLTWKENDHSGINQMRMSMVLAKYFNEGGKA